MGDLLSYFLSSWDTPTIDSIVANLQPTLSKEAAAAPDLAASTANQLATDPSMLSKFFTDSKGGFTMDNLLKPVGLGGQLWGAYNQEKMAKKQYKLQKDAYNYNKELSEEERQRRSLMDEAFANGYGA
jgi:hypothetical protein